MRSREKLEEIRNNGKKKLGLRVRMIILVTIELVVTLGVAVLFEKIASRIFPNWSIPPFLSLITISLLIGAGITSFVSKRFFAPIKKLRKAMEKVADGDYNIRLNDNNSSSEIEELYAGFNMMTNELNNTEILKTDFVSNVSHEFKTPINAIEGYSTLLQDCDNLDENQREYVEKILYNTKRLSRLASNILLLSKIEKQSIPTNQSTYDLDEQIRQSIVALEPVWENKKIDFDVELENAEYYGNESLMHHVWDNLIGNAIKFNPVGGLIRIRLRHHQNQFIFTVDDRGPGVDEEAQKHIFDKFYQGDTSHKVEGNGLGLTLVNNILALENGTMSVENLSEGGCRFTVVLKDKNAAK